MGDCAQRSLLKLQRERGANDPCSLDSVLTEDSSEPSIHDDYDQY